jgi:peptidoglycan/xylan/chitin deacetylase (PgdA/CDA1 family)
MHAVARASRPIVAALIAAALLATLVAVRPVTGASFSLRLEAGPHHAVQFSATWRVTAGRTVTLAAPAGVTGSRRVDVPDRGVYLKVGSGPLAGWWVKENRLSYRPGYAGTRSWTPSRTASLRAGAYELYHFDAAGAMTDASGLDVATTRRFHLDRASVIDGRHYVQVADGAWAGWWIPGTAATPKAIDCSAGAPPSGTGAHTVRSVARATGKIALTFDMGGRLTPAVRIVRFLELERVCTTIFPTGDAAQTDVGRQVLAEVRAHPELFELGNHTVHHCNLRDGGGGAACPATRPTSAFVTAELDDADAIIAGIAGRSTVPYWRPPYGALDATLAEVAAGAGYPYTIMWSTDTIDWRPQADGGPNAAEIAAKVVAGRKAGAIVLMHLGGYQTRNALPAIINGLRAAHDTPTSISALYR